jgi:hypothetical protein
MHLFDAEAGGHPPFQKKTYMKNISINRFKFNTSACTTIEKWEVLEIVNLVDLRRFVCT